MQIWKCKVINETIYSFIANCSFCNVNFAMSFWDGPLPNDPHFKVLEGRRPRSSRPETEGPRAKNHVRVMAFFAQGLAFAAS
jgi:hypothetical protein